MLFAVAELLVFIRVSPPGGCHPGRSVPRPPSEYVPYGHRNGGPITLITPPDVSREGLNFYSWSFFHFYQSTVFSIHAVDDYQMYFGGSVVG